MAFEDSDHAAPSGGAAMPTPDGGGRGPCAAARFCRGRRWGHLRRLGGTRRSGRGVPRAVRGAPRGVCRPLVMPAQAGIQGSSTGFVPQLDSRLRGNDGALGFGLLSCRSPLNGLIPQWLSVPSAMNPFFLRDASPTTPGSAPTDAISCPAGRCGSCRGRLSVGTGPGGPGCCGS